MFASCARRTKHSFDAMLDVATQNASPPPPPPPAFQGTGVLSVRVETPAEESKALSPHSDCVRNTAHPLGICPLLHLICCNALRREQQDL